MNSRRRSAFTLVELLVVIGIIALLVSILIPVLGTARERAMVVKCQAQLHSLGQAVLMYANENKGKVPQESEGIWLWDLGMRSRDALVKKGAARNALYCPMFPEQNVKELWEGTFGGATNPTYCVIGYYWLGWRPRATDPTQTDFPILNGQSYVKVIGKMPDKPQAIPALAPRNTSEVILMADAVLYQNGQWTGKGGWSQLHVTPHMKKGVPQGANILFLDFHVGFRPYKAKFGPTDEVIRKRNAGTQSLDYWF
ncbi:MAG: type II secretion system protein [Tepidisphaeraceae bacterium]